MTILSASPETRARDEKNAERQCQTQAMISRHRTFELYDR